MQTKLIDSLFLGKTSRRHSEGADDDERSRRRGMKRSHTRRLEFKTEDHEEAASAAQSTEDEDVRRSFELLQFEDAAEDLPAADESDDHDPSHYDEGEDNETTDEQEAPEWNDVGVIESWIGKPTRTRYKVKIVIVKCSVVTVNPEAMGVISYEL